MITSPADFQLIIGKKPWRVWKGFGSFLLLEFGRRHRPAVGDCHGTYTLWIYMADWRIRDSGRELAHSESPDKRIQRAAEALTGKKLEGMMLSTVVLQRRLRYGAVFHFEDSLSLRATMYERGEDDDAIFFLCSPTTCFSYNRDGTITAEAVNR